MLAECTDGARGRLMRAAATQRLGPPGVPDRLESDVPLITDTGFDRQERAIALYGEGIDGPADDIQTDGRVHGRRVPTGRLESDDVSLITDAGFDRQGSDVSLIANPSFTVGRLTSDVQL